VSKKEVDFWKAGFFSAKRKAYIESFLNDLDWLDKSRPSKKATSRLDM